MEKQLAFFPMEENDESTIWPDIPKENQQKIEGLLARLLVRYLSSSLKEVKENENR